MNNKVPQAIRQELRQELLEEVFAKLFKTPLQQPFWTPSESRSKSLRTQTNLCPKQGKNKNRLVPTFSLLNNSIKFVLKLKIRLSEKQADQKALAKSLAVREKLLKLRLKINRTAQELTATINENRRATKRLRQNSRRKTPSAKASKNQSPRNPKNGECQAKSLKFGNHEPSRRSQNNRSPKGRVVKSGFF